MDELREERGARKHPVEKLPPSDKLPKDIFPTSSLAILQVRKWEKWKRVRFMNDEDESSSI